MQTYKLLHPSVDVLRVDGKDAAALEFAMVVIHDIGWLTQQCGIESATERLKEYYNHNPQLFISGCAHGAAALHALLGRTAEKP